MDGGEFILWIILVFLAMGLAISLIYISEPFLFAFVEMLLYADLVMVFILGSTSYR
jgi:hypothetical protein